jgi:hypothetical protein
MVGAGAAGGDQLVAHPAGEWQIGDPVTVQVAQLATAKPKLNPAEPVRTDLHAFPGRDYVSDTVAHADIAPGPSLLAHGHLSRSYAGPEHPTLARLWTRARGECCNARTVWLYAEALAERRNESMLSATERPLIQA